MAFMYLKLPKYLNTFWIRECKLLRVITVPWWFEADKIISKVTTTAS